MTRVVVSGLGVVAPNAIGVPAFQESLIDMRSGVAYLPELADAGLKCQIGGRPHIDPSMFSRAVRNEDGSGSTTFLDYLVVAALECWQNAGFAVAAERERDDDCGVIVGSAFGGSIETTISNIPPVLTAQEVRLLGTRICERAMGSSGSARLAGLLGLGGPTFGLSNACASGADAVLIGYTLIRAGVVKRMLVGGCEGFSPHICAIFDSMRITTRQWNRTPEKGSRPLAEDSSGFVPSGGAGLLMLESRSEAYERGATIYAEILGGHMNSGGQRCGGTMFRPNYTAFESCIRSALQQAGVSCQEVDLVNGHFTATKADSYEFQCWINVLGTHPIHFPLVNATKSLIGHTLGASGAIELVGTVLQLQRGFVHGTRNLDIIHPKIAAYVDRVSRETVYFPVKIAVKSALGFGDVNNVLVLGRANANS